jgi:hypothetical protein
MPRKIRRQVYELTPQDLASSEVWEFVLDEEGEPDQDEATVRPLSFSGTLDPSAGMFVVAARFRLADGTEMRGYLTPPSGGDRGLGTIQPQIVTESGQVGFWCGRCAPDTALAYQLLGRNASSVFPVHFEAAVALVGGAVSGTVPGFLCLESDFETVRIVT